MIRRVMAFGVWFGWALFAQHPVTGVVLDPSNTPVAGVTVILKQGEAELSSLTSPIGQFRFENVLPGEYDLLISVPGFDPINRRTRVGAQ
jgi:hypothetical protein